MKRFFICAAAAIVALASCSKTEVVNTSAPEEIGFKAVTGAITKAEQTDATLDGTMGVLAFVHGGTTPYFANTSFSKTGTYWTASPSQYWPVTGALDFAVYAPFTEGTTYASNTLTIPADNSASSDIASQNDYLYGETYYTNSGAGYNKETTSVSVGLKHAQAKVTLSFTGTNVTVTNVKLDAPVLKGSCAVDYSTNPATVTWTPGAANSSVVLIASADLTNVASAASLLVVPETTSSFTFTYQMDGSTTTLNHTINTETWKPGNHYTYNVNIVGNEIKFAPEVDPSWGTGTGSTTTM